MACAYAFRHIIDDIRRYSAALTPAPPTFDAIRRYDYDMLLFAAADITISRLFLPAIRCLRLTPP